MAKISLTSESLSSNLNFSTAQKMIHRLLNHDRIKTDLDESRIRGLGSCNDKPVIKVKAFTRRELAERLGINSEELERLNSPDFYEDTVSKISLPLISLYCAIKFANGEYKDK
jgi:hypothetical protein